MKKNKVIIIAEAGVNHNGDINIAKKLIDLASEAGADFIKFQTFNSKKLVTQTAQRTNYQKINLIEKNKTQFSMLKKLELSNDDHYILQKYCENKGICFLSTAFDLDSLNFLNSINMKLFKIPSGEITNYPYLKKISEFGKPVMLSTGMSTLDEISDALDVLTSVNLTKKDITILHCSSDYPTKFDDVNLLAITNIKEKFGTDVGYSDHTLGISISLAAVSVGAKVIEKHITLSNNMIGPDHKASIEPKELKLLVKSIREIELALKGDGKKKPNQSEMKNMRLIRKGMYFKRNMKSGEIIKDSDIICLRPFVDLSPMDWNKVIDKKLNIDVNKNDAVILKQITYE